MKRALTLFSAVALLQAGGAIAKPKHVRFSDVLRGTETPSNAVAFKLRAMANSSINLNKTTSTERLSVIRDYDFIRMDTEDSIRLVYSNGRGSKYDFLNMGYNETLAPYPLSFGESYIQFDKAFDELDHGNEVTRRSYDASNHLTKVENDEYATLYQYHPSGALSAIIGVRLNLNGNWDSLYREFYVYNSAGNVILDSAELWNSGWERNSKFEYLYDANGRRSSVLAHQLDNNGDYRVIASVDFSYSGNSVRPNQFLIKETQMNSTVLENYQLDQFADSNGTQVYHITLEWNTTTALWQTTAEEFRHLNSANLPDSIAMFEWNRGRKTDSTYTLYEYNAQNNPIAELRHQFDALTPYYGTYYKYESGETAGLGDLKPEVLELYPNPANDKIQLRGISKGSYVIYNVAGQMVQSGTLRNGAIIPVQSVTPGDYILSVIDEAGHGKQARFVKM